jgi:hypothetical protein
MKIYHNIPALLISNVTIFILSAIAYLSPCYAGIKIIEITPPCRARPAVVHEGRAYLLGMLGRSHLSIWDVKNKVNIFELGRYDQKKDRMWRGTTVNMKYNTYSINDGGIGQCRGGLVIVKSGPRYIAFIPTGHHGLQAVDVTDPMNIFGKRIAKYPNTGEGIYAVKNIRNYIFMAASYGGFDVFEMGGISDEDPYPLIEEYRYAQGRGDGTKGFAVSKRCYPSVSA